MMAWLRVTGMPVEQVEINRLNAVLCGSPAPSLPLVYAIVISVCVILLAIILVMRWMEGCWPWRGRCGW